MKIATPLLVLAASIQGASAFSAYLDQLNAAPVVNGGAAVPAPPVPAAPAQSIIGPSAEMLSLVSKQVSVELMASQQYMAASIWFRSRNMDGMAAWMLDESDEERGHGKEILEFAMKNHYQVTIEPLAAPQAEWNSPVDVWATILALEENNTQNLLRIAQEADACGQYGVKAFLDPFHVEQIEAEDKVGGILAKVQGASDTLLWEIDHLLGQEAEEEGHH
eukprot:CAMPEP_0172394344 /NCGR_PEP_ID=MMETSP1061-20121228/14431_1 /TAXON_ID=37318 /ORGANISM="Pseudo-nitzschia pungens, Strain cf. pungens" /LENGTH=219 /DNA_ID=CAMNT_0013125671 /DNA_START=139 /DNA_END=798 /DNA_ORIENTATION=+